jgi:hypothetical protein
MKMLSCLFVAIVAALLSGGCVSAVPEPTTAPTPTPIKVVVVPAPPATTAPAAAPVFSDEESVLVTTGVEPVAALPTPIPVAAPTPATVATAAVAVPPPAKTKAPVVAPPKVVTYAATPGKVTFDHQQHAGTNTCSACHATGNPPVKVVLGKDKAHQLCKGCHQQKGAPAPTACGGCHKKG